MSKELNKALDLLREIRPSIPKDVLELWCKDRDAFLASHKATVEQAGGDERAAFELFVRKHCGMPAHIAVNWDAKFTNDAWEGWQARAALAQPSPVRSSLLINGYQLRAALDFIAPDGTAEQLESEACIEWRQQDADFLEAGLYAFCAEYPEEGGVLLDEEPTTAQPSRVQAEQHWPKLEKPAQVGAIRFHAGLSSRLVVEAAQRLYEFESTPEKEAERIERLQAFREQLDPLNLAPHAEAFNEAPDEALRPEQAEAERSALWAVHAQGPDELYAAFSREDAEKHAAELNALPMPEGIAVGAVVVPSPWPAVQHWQYLAEQEQDHKNEIAGRLRQHERIGEALRAEITQLRQHKNDYMDAGQETYRALQNEIREREAEIARLDGLVSGHTAERDAALARVAELERQEPVGWEWIEVFVGGNFDGEEADNGFYRGTDKENILPSIEGTEVRQRPLYAAPVAQTQHSVPEGWVQSLPLKNHQPCKPNEDRANGYTIPIYSRPALVEEALRKLRAVLCDPIGNVVIDGSDSDREEVQQALGMLAAAPGKEGV